ncbi:hypothetical protein V9K67_10265 [Paraflavisolibacter sp. H34]|uniref:hypothetical protein n=1 Tax=Huijunlia imazamoxiresistens TaxID=3127457 RepID=UPI00301B3C70
MLEKIFKRTKKKESDDSEPDIQFGRYSDNNKPLAKVEKWNEADASFKQKKFNESVHAFLEYLKDEEAENVVHEPNGDGTEGTFHFYQGSKMVRGFYNREKLQAEVTLAIMPTPSVPVMRRLLEMNFNLYYSRSACNGDKLVMLFDSSMVTANPSKLYYGLKELATKADKNDDLLLADFATLVATDDDHVLDLPEEEKKIKYKYFQKWIKDTLSLIESVDSDKFSGGIAYLLLALAYRIDYLIVPHGKLLAELEKIVDIYFKKDDRLVTEKNQEMIELFTKLATRTEDQFYPFLFHSKYTFSIVNPQSYKTIADAIYNANQNINWYKENKQPRIAALISEYGIAYCEYSYSLPRPITDFFHLFMMVNYPDFFTELGFTKQYYDQEKEELNQQAIIEKIQGIEEAWKEKYPELKFKTDKLKFDSLLAFNQSFTTEVEFLNLETK